MDDARAKADLHKSTAEQTKRTELSIRSAAMDMAIRSSVGTKYDDEGRAVVEADRIVEAAKKFEIFIKGN